MRTNPGIGVWAACAWAAWMTLCAVAQAALPQNTAGWSAPAPSADSRLIYVSDTDGDDSTAQYYLPGDAAIGSDPRNPVGAILPYKTVTAATAVGGPARVGFPDWVLLKRGDTWVYPTLRVRAGRNDAERSVVTSYGPASARPVLKTGENKAFTWTGNVGSTNYQMLCFAVVGLDFYAHTRDPQSPDYAPGLGGSDGIALLNNGGAGSNFRDILFEDCAVRWYWLGADIQAINPVETINDIALRRCVITDSYSTSSAHSQGMYAHGVSGLLLEENLFDHCGWLTANTGGGPGQATTFNHDTYFSDCDDILFRNNLFLRASADGNKWTSNSGVASNLTMDNNLYVEGEGGIDIGGNVAGPLRFANCAVTNNVMLDIGRIRPEGDNLSWGIRVVDWDGGTVSGNLVLHQQVAAVTGTYAINLAGSGPSTRNVTVSDNIAYGLKGSFSNNYLFTLNATGGNNRLVRNTAVGTAGAGIGLMECSVTSGFSFSGGAYWSTVANETNWFKAGGANKDFNGWIAATGETSATKGNVSFPSPDRTVETYDAFLGGPGTFDHFIAEARSQSATNWRRQYTAVAANDYVRLGFGIGNVPPYFAIDPFAKPAATVGVAYGGSIAPDAGDPNPSDVLTFSKISGPAWLSVAADGTLSGTPAQSDSGTATFVVRVTDMNGAFGDATMTIAASASSPVSLWWMLF